MPIAYHAAVRKRLAGGCILGAAMTVLVLAPIVVAQRVDQGRKSFESRCARCHGADGNGGEMGPSITRRLPPLDQAALEKVIRDGVPTKGMPPSVVAAPEMADLVAFLRSIERRESDEPIVRRTITTTDDKTITGRVLNEGFDDLQLRTDDAKVHLLRRAGDRYRSVTSGTDWPTYNGETGGNRYTTLTGIDKTNVARLAPAWMFSIPDAGQLQLTPVVAGGIMYVTAPNEAYALDAGTGRRLWHYKRPRTKGVAGGWANRGVGVAGDRVFMVTDHAHLLALQPVHGRAAVGQ